MGRKVIIRMDDICPCMKKEPFERMQNILDKYEATAIIGVVPECRDPKLNIEAEDPFFWKKIKELQEKGWTVAMHGCFHEYVTKNNGYLSDNNSSEFAGLSYEKQLAKLQYGKNKLKENGIETDVFMAPSHSYDKNTLCALRELGFKYITDGLTSRPYMHFDLVFIPCIESKITKAKRLMTVCYHTNTIAEERFIETEKLLKEYRDQVISFSDAYTMPRRSYAIARFEELLRWIWKYRIKRIAYHIMNGARGMNK